MRILFFPEIVMLRGVADASRGSRSTIHLRSGPGIAFLTCPPHSTVTSSPASAQPQTGAGTPRWSTMPLEIIEDKTTSARTSEKESARVVRDATRMSSFFIV